MTTTATTLVTGPLARADQFAEHPDRQRLLLAGGEGGDDHLVERKREGQHAAGQQRRADVGQHDVAEGLEPVGAEIHRGLDQRRRQCGGSARRRCCRRRRCRRWRGRARWSRSENGMSTRLNAERSEMPVMMPGRAIGRMTSSDTASRPKNCARDTAAAHSVPRTSAIGVETAATCSDSASACQMSGRLQATANQLQRQARRRQTGSSFLGGEGVEEDDRPAADAGTAGRAAAASFRPRGAMPLRAHRTPPCRLAPPEIEAHDDDRHHGEGRRQRDVAGRALLRVDRLADERAAKGRRSAGTM